MLDIGTPPPMLGTVRSKQRATVSSTSVVVPVAGWFFGLAW